MTSSTRDLAFSPKESPILWPFRPSDLAFSPKSQRADLRLCDIPLMFYLGDPLARGGESELGCGVTVLETRSVSGMRDRKRAQQ